MKANFITEPDNKTNTDAVSIEVCGEKIGYVNNAQCLAFKKCLVHYCINASVANISGFNDRPLIYIFGRVDWPQTQKAVA